MRKAKIAFLCIVLLTNCSGSENFEIENLSNKYSIQALHLFSESGFHHKDKVFKWKQNITISHKGSSTTNDIKNIDSLIEEFEPLLNGLTLTRVKEYGSIVFNFTANFTEPGHTMAQGKASIKVKTFFKSEIYKATVYIMPELAESSRRETMRHEFMHALGLTHSATIENTILSDRTVYKSIEELEKSMVYEKISGLDEALVRMLYEDSIPFGLKKSEFKKQLERLETRE
jgi:hypothetical protein